MEQILTVSQLTSNIKILLETGFGTLWVTGEVSNLRRPGSGHIYFTLKDEECQIKAAIFRRSMETIGFDLEDGLSILCRGRLSVYAPRGEYQLIVDMAEPKGIGALQIAFEQLKRRLKAEGLFNKKQSIPYIPNRIGVITSPSGAALRDFLQITQRRFPSMDILIVPVRVQGTEAASEISRAIETLNDISTVDVIVITRGGGSLEDLYPFNAESVARAIYRSRIPIVSAVGHEIDFTIADFVADLRAPTPSAAAEMVVPDTRELAAHIRMLCHRMEHCYRIWRNRCRERIGILCERIISPVKAASGSRIYLDDLLGRLFYSVKKRSAEKKNRMIELDHLLYRYSPQVKIYDMRRRVDTLKKEIIVQYRHSNEKAHHRLEKTVSILQSINPLAVLSRGYSITRLLPDGDLVREIASLSEGSAVSVQVRSGIFHASVTELFEEKENGRKKI
ncbi:MAG: exodeoxyribonuclease VII large subunit [Syntrophales bacterium]|jgi:exodeoxyribonuclease VII large subunit|nr:exodeoxyribonuclease VII large subunit [Syntrophales bacterium]MDY0043383.1 exodeoxyribonuclease VII large subunit [Syntrophales bacterium]